MVTFLSLVTSIKDYIEVVNKFVESDPKLALANYENFGAVLTYLILTAKTFLVDLVSFNWLQKIWSLPIVIPEIASSIVSEVSILDNYFHNVFNFLDTPLSYGSQNSVLANLEKFSIGFVNSFFLFLPTSTAHLIVIRRFVMQGLEAGYIAGLGTIAGNLLWIASIIFGWRFIVIPWLSLDIFRYLFGFLLLVKYMWDTYNEKKVTLEDLSKKKIFLLSFLLAFTEQTTVYPFVSNLAIGSEATMLETFPVSDLSNFIFLHSSYLIGLAIGSVTLLNLVSWFFENPAYNIYMWLISTLKVTTTTYSKILNFVFLYLTMLCAVSNFAYFGLDYTITNPLGLTHEDRLIDQKAILETSFLSTKASDRNTRRNRGRHGRRERWKRRIRKYRTFDASLYDQGVYDLFSVEDLNYGFDRFWLRRKMRNHRVRFRFFPGPWMRSFKKQLATPRLESFMGPRVEFFRMLFEQVYHPSFHERTRGNNVEKTQLSPQNFSAGLATANLNEQNTKNEMVTLRKFLRKFDTRVSSAKSNVEKNLDNSEQQSVLSKRWKKIAANEEAFNGPIFEKEFGLKTDNAQLKSVSPQQFNQQLYQDFLKSSPIGSNGISTPNSLLHPAKLYLQREKAFRKKLRFYGIQLFRNFGIENNSPYFRVLMRKYFYYYKPTLRWKRTMRNASLRKALRKNSRQPRRFKANQENVKTLSNVGSTNQTTLQLPTHNYSILGKKASRYRAQIYKDVLQHWYYSPFNRLLLKFDIDEFIRRQPQAHFLTKNEEYLLHLRRFLLGEHYDTFRWYTYMQHYQTMKSQIGGTKSLSSRVYNQQFQGTFKKIRHLFAITPNENLDVNNSSFNVKNVLKFDQPLYNEYLNKTNQSIIDESVLHEELRNGSGLSGGTLTEKSTNLLKGYMMTAQPVRQAIISNLLKEKDYDSLTKFIYTGQKTRGEKPVTSRKAFLTQEAEFLLSSDQQKDLTAQQKETLKQLLKTELKDQPLLLVLLKNTQSQLYDQEALKYYLSRRVEKREKIQAKFEKNLKTRLQRLTKWFEIHKQNLNAEGKLSRSSAPKTILDLNLKTGIQKALKDAISYQQEQIGGKASQKAGKKLPRFISKKAEAKRLKVAFKQNLKAKVQGFENVEKTLAEKLDQMPRAQKPSWIGRLQATWNNVVSHRFERFKKANNLSSTLKLDVLKKLETSELAKWKKEQSILTKRKKTRKRFKRLKKKEMFTARFENDETEKLDLSSSRYKLDSTQSATTRQKIWKQWLQKMDEGWGPTLSSRFNITVPKFKIKRSRRRGASRMRARSAIRKASLKQTFRRRRSRRYSSMSNENENIRDSQGMMTSSTTPFELTELKSRRLRQRKNRYWKRAKRPKYAQNKRKVKHRKRSSLTRVRALNKQLERIDSRDALKNWWQGIFIPRLEGRMNAVLENQKLAFLDEKFAKLSAEDLIRANRNKTQNLSEKIRGEKLLQIGDFDYKPLGLPVTMEMLQKPTERNSSQPMKNGEASVEQSFIEKFYSKLFATQANLPNDKDLTVSKMSHIVNGSPFYAGWDENLRKFLVTNRFLSRQEAGYSFNVEKANLTKTNLFANFDSKIAFEKAPLRGMNAATTLYWQIPFTTYDPDQFFALGMDGFSPLAWRRFNFRTMKQTTKPLLVKTLLSSVEKTTQTGLNTNQVNFTANKFKKNRMRRLMKRYRRVKKHPKAPVWFPSGPLSQQILPVHYIYVFYKRNRLPRDRYIRRRLRRSKDGVALGLSEFTKAIPDYTLRRRVKPRRRYHRRKPLRAGTVTFPRRMAFKFENLNGTEKLRARPISKTRLNQQIQEFKFTKAKAERRRKLSKTKDQPMNIRIRQLRRRVQRQVIRPINWRYRPRSGGLVWPGDYLRLEAVRAPRLKSTLSPDNETVILKADSKKTKRKKKRMIQEWQIQPKKYLLQKHNLKVLKKRLEKAQNFAEFNQKVKNLENLFNSPTR